MNVEQKTYVTGRRVARQLNIPAGSPVTRLSRYGASTYYIVTLLDNHIKGISKSQKKAILFSLIAEFGCNQIVC